MQSRSHTARFPAGRCRRRWDTPGTLVLGDVAGVPVAVMRGRAHLYEGHSAGRVAYGVRVLGRLGVRTLVLTNACGGVREDLAPGDLVLVSDHLNLQATSPLIGPNDDSLGPRFPDMTNAYDPELRAAAHAAAARLGQKLSEGVYAAWLGPAFETPAEIRMIRALGGDLVGMSTVPEVLAARHHGGSLPRDLVRDEHGGRDPAGADRRGARARGRGGRAGQADGIARRDPAGAERRVSGLAAYTPSVAQSLRNLPSVDRLLADPRLAAEPRPLALAAARAALEQARDAIRAGADPGDPVELALSELESTRRPSLRRVLNATGVLVHTNLGRAPLAEAALDRVVEVGGGYSNLEYDLEAGARGSRQDHLSALVRRITGAEAALVVNNNAAAVLLALAALAEGREVLVSRGELIEIGDGFRIPDVLARSGATARRGGDDEPHASRRLRARDRRRTRRSSCACTSRTSGSSASPSSRGSASSPSSRTRQGIPLVDDLGSGALFDLGDEPTAAASLAAGADLVCFSGDKLLGGPQAGIVAGRAELVERLRRHPLQRALRADKLTLAALEGTLALVLDPERARREIPVLRMLDEPAEAVRARAGKLAALVGGEVEETVARVGGGALPLAELPSFACAIEEELFEPLRLGKPPVVGIVRDGRLLLDVRALGDDEVDAVAAAVTAARAR